MATGYAQSSADAISELPDAVLHQILSSLPTKEAVRTGVLSSRWRHVWSGIPALDFNQEEFSSQELFHAGVQGTMSVRDADAPVTSFRLAVSDGVDHFHVFEWLEYALARKVEEVVLEVSIGSERGYSGVVPESLLKCPSIRSLKLSLPLWKLVLDPDAVGLLKLRTLHLKGIQSCTQSLGNLISACPLLEELHMEDCNFCRLQIEAKELKRLTVTRCIFDTFNTLEIVTPKLLWFDYTSGKVQGCFVRDMPSLLNARIVLFNLTHPGSLWKVSEILKGLSNVSSLTFTYMGNQVFTVQYLWFLPIFSNLKFFRLNIVFSHHSMEIIAYMLKHMPELKTLEIHNEMDSSPKEHILWTSKCLTAGALNGLDEIRLGNFKSSEQEIALIDFLLKNGKIVEEINPGNPTSIERRTGSSLGVSRKLYA